MTTTTETTRDNKLERASLSESHKSGGNMPTDNKTTTEAKKPKLTPLTRDDYNELIELWTLKLGSEDKARVKVSEKYRVKGEQGGLYAEFVAKNEGKTLANGELTEKAKVVKFFREIGKTHFAETRDDGSKYCMRFNGANINDKEGETAK